MLKQAAQEISAAISLLERLSQELGTAQRAKTFRGARDAAKTGQSLCEGALDRLTNALRDFAVFNTNEVDEAIVKAIADQLAGNAILVNAVAGEVVKRFEMPDDLEDEEKDAVERNPNAGADQLRGRVSSDVGLV